MTHATGTAMIRPVTPGSRRRAAETLTRAFQDDPLVRFVHPNEVTRPRWLGVAFGVMITFGQRFGRVEEAEGHAGVAVWVAPEHAHVTAWHFLRADGGVLGLHSSRDVLRRGLRFLEAIDVAHRGILPAPHWYLPIIGVEPSRQGAGIGSRLLASVLGDADRSVLPTYAETPSERSLDFYERHGFRVMERFEVAPGGPMLWAMVREPVTEPRRRSTV
jgi:GNAT superfamily N-acetyltransferase